MGFVPLFSTGCSLTCESGLLWTISDTVMINISFFPHPTHCDGLLCEARSITEGEGEGSL